MRDVVPSLNTLLLQVGRKSEFIEADNKENLENIPVIAAVTAGTLTDEDREKIKVRELDDACSGSG